MTSRCHDHQLPLQLNARKKEEVKPQVSAAGMTNTQSAQLEWFGYKAMIVTFLLLENILLFSDQQDTFCQINYI